MKMFCFFLHEVTEAKRHLTNFFGSLSDFCMKLNDFLGKILLWGLGAKRRQK